METINDLLKALDNKVPTSIAKRLDGLKKLNEKLVTARQGHDANPTEESQENLDEILEFINDTQDDLKEDLSILVDAKRRADLELQEEANRKARSERLKKEAKEKAEAEEREKSQREAQSRKSQAREKAPIEARERAEKEELEKEQLEEEALKKDPKTETEKKSGIDWGGLLLGGALLVLTGGAIKYFGTKK